MRSRFTLIVAVPLAVSIISCNYGGMSLTSTPVVATMPASTEPTPADSPQPTVATMSAPTEPTPTDSPEPTVATLTTRDDVKVTLSNPTISYGYAAPQLNREAVWIDGVFVRFDYVQSIEFGDLPTDCCSSPGEYHIPVLVTLVDGSILDGFSKIWGAGSSIVRGQSDLGHETGVWEVRSIVFEHPAPVKVPSLPPPATNKDAVSAIVTDTSGRKTLVSDLVFYFYNENDAWSPPIITNVTYRYLPISTGPDIDLDKIESIEFSEQYPADDWDEATITLADGEIIIDRVRFNPRDFPEADENSFIDVEGDAALGRLDLELEDVRMIEFQQE